MKNKYKIILLAVILVINSIPGTAFAGMKTVYSDDKKLLVSYPEREIGAYIVYNGSKEECLMDSTVRCLSGGAITGSYSYPNYNNSSLGDYDLQWIFTPDDSKYQSIYGTLKAKVIIVASGTTSEDDNAIPSLMSPTISMEIGTTYTPQIIDNIQDSDYLWTTSDRTIVKINKKTGKMYALSPGTATVTCRIDTPYDDTFTLTTDVTVLSNTKAARIASNDVITLSKGNTVTLDPNYDSSTSTAVFSSSKSSIARVEPYTGKLIAKKPGMAYITCTIINTNYEISTIRYTVVVTE